MMARFMPLFLVVALIISISHAGRIQKLFLPAHPLEITKEGDVDEIVKDQMDDEEDEDVGKMTAEGVDVNHSESEDNVGEEDTDLAKKSEGPKHQVKRGCRRVCSSKMRRVYVRIRVRVKINFSWRWVTRWVPRRRPRRKCRTICRG